MHARRAYAVNIARPLDERDTAAGQDFRRTLVLAVHLGAIPRPWFVTAVTSSACALNRRSFMIGHRRTTPAPPQPTLAMTRCSSQAISWSAAACTKACRALWPPEPRSCRPARRRPGVLRTSDGDTGQTLSSYPVNYPANLGEPASVQAGNTDLVNHVMSQAAACPVGDSFWSATPRARTSSTTPLASAVTVPWSAGRSWPPFPAR
jgi:hypothetical protein